MVTSIYVLADTIIIERIGSMLWLHLTLCFRFLIFSSHRTFIWSRRFRSLTSIARGRGEINKTGHRYFSMAFLLNIVTCLIYMLVFLLFLETSARFLFGANGRYHALRNGLCSVYSVQLGFFSFSSFLQTFRSE